MALFDELLRAAFKDQEFLISSSATSGGRKDQKHEFPNSDKQTIEDFGLRPRTYNIVGWITEPDYKAKRDALIEALESGTTGVLSHPFYGELENMKARNFSITESMGEFGRAEINMTFEVSNNIGTPIGTENTLSKIYASNTVVKESVNAQIADNWEVTPSFPGNFTAAQNKLGEVSDSFDSASKVVVQQTDGINAFNASISDFGTNINSLIKSPQALADSVINIGEGMNALYATAKSQYTAWLQLFDFGDNQNGTTVQTAGTVQRAKNNTAINSAMQAQALGYAYLASAQVDYLTVDDLDVVAEQLEDQYQKLANGSGVDRVVREALTDMRENTNAYFNQLRLNLNRIVDVFTSRLPSRVIAYQYYGSSELGEGIAALNKDANVSFIDGQIQVFTE